MVYRMGLATVDMDEHAVRVDMRDLLICAFPETEIQGNDGFETDGVVIHLGGVFFRTEEFQIGSVLFEGDFAEEFSSAEGDSTHGSEPFSFGFVVKEVLLELSIRDFIKNTFITF